MTKKKENKSKETKVVNIPETRYSRSEIIGAASSFGESQEVIAGALRIVNKEELTRSEVENAIRKFKTRKVH